MRPTERGIARLDFADLEAVIQAIPVALMCKAVELRADLAEFGGNQFFIAAALVRLRIHERALGMHIELAGSLDRHARPEHVTEFDHLSGADQARRVEHRRRLHVIGRAPLVARTPLGGAAFARGGRLPGLRASNG